MVVCEFKNFNTLPYSRLNKSDVNVNLRYIDLIRHVQTAGFCGMRFARRQGGVHRLSELHFMVRGCVKEVKRGHAVHFSLHKETFNELDASEQRAKLYMLGQGLTQAIACAKLGITHLLHFDKFEHKELHHSWQRPKIKLNGSKEGARPDFVGVHRNGQFSVFEAKSSQTGYDTRALQKAINQVSQVSLIQGLKPQLAVACEFNLEGIFRGRVYDPDANESGIAIDFSLDDLLKSYYRPFIHDPQWKNARRIKVDQLQREYCILPVGNGHWFGLDTSLLQSAQYLAKAVESLPDEKAIEAVPDKEQVSIGLDGTILQGPPNDGTIVVYDDYLLFTNETLAEGYNALWNVVNQCDPNGQFEQARSGIYLRKPNRFVGLTIHKDRVRNTWVDLHYPPERYHHDPCLPLIKSPFGSRAIVESPSQVAAAISYICQAAAMSIEANDQHTVSKSGKLL